MFCFSLILNLINRITGIMLSLIVYLRIQRANSFVKIFTIIFNHYLRNTTTCEYFLSAGNLSEKFSSFELKSKIRSSTVCETI